MMLMEVVEVVNHHWCHFLFLKCADVYKSGAWQSKVLYKPTLQDCVLRVRHCIGIQMPGTFTMGKWKSKWNLPHNSEWEYFKAFSNDIYSYLRAILPPLTFYWVFQLWWCPFINKFFRHGILGSQSHEIVSTDIWSLIALLSIQALQTSATIQQK